MDNIIKNNRITSLDALRAFALWGILITHTTQLFNFNNSYNDISFFSSDSITLFKYLLFLFSGRFKIIFSILFGVSFYLLLKNPQYSNIKFLWRLTLLMGFGLLNKLFYTTEILFWYGLCGVILLLFRGMTIKRLLVWFVSLYMSFILFKMLGYKILDFPQTDYAIRYQAQLSFGGIVSYTLYDSICDYLSMIFPYGLIETLSYFVFGYILGKSNVIYNLNKYVKFKNILIMSIVYILMIILYRNQYNVILKSITEFMGAIVYSLFFLYIYNVNPSIFRVFENYGKCGLTNYTLQNIIGVVIVYFIVFPYKLDGIYILIIMSLLYMCQVLLSNLWMNKLTYGPLEYLWRRLTDLVK